MAKLRGFSPSYTDNEMKEQSVNFALSKADDELYDESKHTIEPIIRIKRTGKADKNEKWKIFKNDEMVMVIDGTKITNKERKYLRSVDGVKFLLLESKTTTTFKALRAKLRKNIN